MNDYIIKAKVDMLLLISVLNLQQTENKVSLEQGLYPNIDEYYTSPPKVLLVPHLVGTRDDLKQIVKILITAA